MRDGNLTSDLSFSRGRRRGLFELESLILFLKQDLEGDLSRLCSSLTEGT